MSEDSGMTMEEAEETGEHDLPGREEKNQHGEQNVAETPEDLMTDMKLEDEIDELRLTDPDFQWSYHIEIYPWNADDMTENFVRLLKLADFTQIFMRKKGACKETREQESMDDKLHDRQRKGGIHLYTDSFQNAKLIIRSSTWKAMISKQLTFEITRREPGTDVLESAYLEVDTYTACKCRYRDRPKGEFKDRTAKVSCIPGGISREFLDVVLCRAIPVMGGSSVKEYYQERDGKLHQKLSQIQDFKGSLDFDCLTKASCRAFVTAHKNVYIDGQRISINANSKETMTAPPPAPCVAPSAINYAAIIANRKLQSPSGPESLLQNSTVDIKSQQVSNRGTLAQQATLRGNLAGHISQVGRGGLIREPAGLTMSGRGRGVGRSTVLPQRPVNNTLSRSGPGMPVPMTGRQKMNEKMRRSTMGLVPGPPTSNNMSTSQGGLMLPRSAISASLGESFKQEIALLQKQLQQNTAELEAKIALLRESTHSAALYDEWDEDWTETGFGGEEGDYSQDNFVSGEDPACTSLPLSGNYHVCFEDMSNPHAMGLSDTQAGPDGTLQNTPTASRVECQRELQQGSTTATQEMVAPFGDFGQTPMSHVAIMSMLQTRPGQSLQHTTGHLPQNMPGQLPHTVQGHLPQNMPGQLPHTVQGQMSQNKQGQMPQAMLEQMPHTTQRHMPQTFSGYMPQTISGQIPQTMSGQMPQPAPVQLAQALLDQMAHVLPGQLRHGNYRQFGSEQGAPPGQSHAQRGGGRVGGGYYQRMRGSVRGRGGWG